MATCMLSASFCSLPVIERFKIYEQTLISLEGVSDKYGYQYLEVLKNTRAFDKTYYDDIIYVPFEGFDMPVFARYDEFLTWWFGDYMTPYIRKQHSAIFNPDVSYEDYFRYPDKYIDTMQLGVDI